jgi:glycosyltransferase involved in cell wall biosynthesis
MRILFLNRSFWPDTDVTGVLLAELAEDLAVDHQVTVICGPANSSPNRMWPLLHREQYGAVTVVRTSGAKLSKKNLLLRLMSLHAYFALATIAALRERADIIIAETDPPLLGALAAIVKRLTGCRFVYYCQDLYPDIAQVTGGLKSLPLLWFLHRCNGFAYRHADAIVVLGTDMADRLRSKGVPANQIVVIPNWIDCRRVKPQTPSRWPRRCTDDFIVMYAGNLGWSQNLESVLEAARMIRGDRRVKFLLVGDGTRKSSLEREARLLRLDNVEFIERQPPHAMSEVLAAGDLHLIPLAAGAAGCLVPSKVYGILAAGRPFVAMMERRADIAQMALEFEVGFVVPPGDAGALASTISDAMNNRELLEEMGRRARILAEEMYDRRVVIPRFAALLEAMLPVASLPRRGEEIAEASTLPSERVVPVSIE